MKVIDVSQYNGSISWAKVARSCDGAIIRVGYRGYGKGALVTDKSFKNNIAGATAAGVPIGVYFVTQAINEDEAREEARYTMALIKGYKLLYPVFADSENGANGKGRADRGKLTKAKRTAILAAFCDEVEKAGYKAGIYASQSWFINDLNREGLEKYYLWVAKYSSVKPSIKYNAWQYTSKGAVDGVTGNVDISDFLTAAGAKKSNEEIAIEVISGKWGNGEDRKARLTAAGYDYKAVQEIINARLKVLEDNSAAYHMVKRGDTLSRIAAKYNTTVNVLKALNNLTDPNRIYAGQKIRIK